MKLKECMEDTADNKVWGDWMLINLCVLCPVQYACLSSSLMSWSWFSRPPLNGMTKAPGSWLSTHSLIFTNLVESSIHRTSWMTWLSRECLLCAWRMHIHDSSWTNIWAFAGDCSPKVAFCLRQFDFVFIENFQLKVWLTRTYKA